MNRPRFLKEKHWVEILSLREHLCLYSSGSSMHVKLQAKRKVKEILHKNAAE